MKRLLVLLGITASFLGIIYQGYTADPTEIEIAVTADSMDLLKQSFAEIEDALDDLHQGVVIGNMDQSERAGFQIYRGSRDARELLKAVEDLLPKDAKKEAEDLHDTLLKANRLQQEIQARGSFTDTFLEFSEQYSKDKASLLQELEAIVQLADALGS